MKITITKNRSTGNIFYGARKLFMLLALCLGSISASANQNMIESIQYDTLPGNRLQVILKMSQEAIKPLSFTIDNPARIVFDFTGTGSSLPKKQQPIGKSVV